MEVLNFPADLHDKNISYILSKLKLLFIHKMPVIFPASSWFLFSSEPKILFSYKSQIDEPEDSDVHLPNTSSSGLGRKDLDHGSYSSTQIDGSGAYLDDVVSGPFGGAHSINSIDSDRWRALNTWTRFNTDQHLTPARHGLPWSQTLFPVSAVI